MKPAAKLRAAVAVTNVSTLTLADLIEFNAAHAAEETQYIGTWRQGSIWASVDP